MDFESIFNHNGDEAPKELSGDLRNAASQTFNIYTAFMDAGFTSEQSMSIVLEMLRAGAGSS